MAQRDGAKAVLVSGSLGLGDWDIWPCVGRNGSAAACGGARRIHEGTAPRRGDYISTCASVRASSCDGDGEEAGEHRRKSSCVSECSLDDVDLEARLTKVIKASPEKAEKNCHITLGCSCKGDLSYSHKQYALTWFKIRGNKYRPSYNVSPGAYLPVGAVRTWGAGV
ncbi:hypothetical protein ABZP36_007669 [Zizania latifolia]